MNTLRQIYINSAFSLQTVGGSSGRTHPRPAIARFSGFAEELWLHCFERKMRRRRLLRLPLQFLHFLLFLIAFISQLLSVSSLWASVRHSWDRKVLKLPTWWHAEVFLHVRIGRTLSSPPSSGPGEDPY